MRLPVLIKESYYYYYYYYYEDRQQRNVCHRSWYVCMERHTSSQMQTEADGGQCRQ